MAGISDRSLQIGEQLYQAEKTLREKQGLVPTPGHPMQQRNVLGESLIDADRQRETQGSVTTMLQKQQEVADDFKTRAQLESERMGMLDGLSDTYRRSSLQMEQADIASQIVLKRLGIGGRDLAAPDLMRLKQIEDEMARLGPEPKRGVFSGIPAAAVSQLPVYWELLKGAATGAVAGPAVGAGLGSLSYTPFGTAAGALGGLKYGTKFGVAYQAFEAEAGSAYLDFVNLKDLDGNTISPEDAAAGAMLVGVVNAAAEFTSLSMLLKTFSGGKFLVSRKAKQEIGKMMVDREKRAAIVQMAKDFITYLGVEAGTEGFQETTKESMGLHLQGHDMEVILGKLQTDKEIREKILSASLLGGQAAVVFGGFGTTVSAAGHYRKIRSNRVSPGTVDALGEIGKKSELLKNGDVQAHEKMVQDRVRGSSMEQVRIRARAIRDLVNEDDEARRLFSSLVPRFEETLAEAVQRGGDITVPAEKYTSAISPTGYHDKLKNDIRFRDTEFTINDAGPNGNLLQQELDRMFNTSEEKMAYLQSADRLEESLTAQLRSLGLMENRDARKSVALKVAYARTRAIQFGMTPEEFAEKFFADLTGEDGGMMQGPIADPARAEKIAIMHRMQDYNRLSLERLEEMAKEQGVTVPKIDKQKTASRKAALVRALAERPSSGVQPAAPSSSVSPVPPQILKQMARNWGLEIEGDSIVAENNRRLLQTVYHGTGAPELEGGKPSTRFVGSHFGERRQAFGWGLYFADFIGVAKNYKRNLIQVFFNGDMVDQESIMSDSYEADDFKDAVVSLYEGDISWTHIDELVSDDIVRQIRNRVAAYGSLEELYTVIKGHDEWGSIIAMGNPINILRHMIWFTQNDLALSDHTDPTDALIERLEGEVTMRMLEDENINPAEEQTWQDVLEIIHTQELEVIARPGGLFLVELTADNHEYAYWDFTIAEQSQYVRHALEAVMTEIMSEDDIYDPAQYMTFEDLYRQIVQSQRSEKETSMLLAKHGIVGHKFFDGLSRNKRDKNKATFNYVVYDDRIVGDVTRLAQAMSRRGFLKTASSIIGSLFLPKGTISTGTAGEATFTMPEEIKVLAQSFTSDELDILSAYRRMLFDIAEEVLDRMGPEELIENETHPLADTEIMAYENLENLLYEFGDDPNLFDDAGFPTDIGNKFIEDIHGAVKKANNLIEAIRKTLPENMDIEDFELLNAFLNKVHPLTAEEKKEVESLMKDVRDIKAGKVPSHLVQKPFDIDDAKFNVWKDLNELFAEAPSKDMESIIYEVYKKIISHEWFGKGNFRVTPVGYLHYIFDQLQRYNRPDLILEFAKLIRKTHPELEDHLEGRIESFKPETTEIPQEGKDFIHHRFSRLEQVRRPRHHRLNQGMSRRGFLKTMAGAIASTFLPELPLKQRDVMSVEEILARADAQKAAFVKQTFENLTKADVEILDVYLEQYSLSRESHLRDLTEEFDMDEATRMVDEDPASLEFIDLDALEATSSELGIYDEEGINRIDNLVSKFQADFISWGESSQELMKKFLENHRKLVAELPEGKKLGKRKEKKIHQLPSEEDVQKLLPMPEDANLSVRLVIEQARDIVRRSSIDLYQGLLSGEYTPEYLQKWAVEEAKTIAYTNKWSIEDINRFDSRMEQFQLEMEVESKKENKLPQEGKDFIRRRFSRLEQARRIVYHGGSAKLSGDRLSVRFVGSGEGVGELAHGWGLYFTTESVVGQMYEDYVREYGKDGDAATYEVELLRTETFLREGKKLRQQPKSVRYALSKVATALPENAMVDLDYNMDMLLGDNVLAEDFYGTLASLIGGHKAASIFLSDLGIPGMQYVDENSEEDAPLTNFVVWDETAIGSISRFGEERKRLEQGMSRRGPHEPISTEQKEQPERLTGDPSKIGDKFIRGMSPANLAQENDEEVVGWYDPDYMAGKGQIFLSANANLTTFLEECIHEMLFIDAKLASRPDAPQQIITDLQTILDFVGAKTWDDMLIKRSDTEEIANSKKAMHEKYAKAFLTYLAEGKAPSNALRDSFATFRQWISAMFAMMQLFRVQLSPEIRSVFGRMLATDEEIADASRQVSASDMFGSAELAEMSDSDYTEYLRGIRRSRDEATRRLDAASAKAAKAKIRSTKAYRERRKVVRMEVEADLSRMPGWSLILALRMKDTFRLNSADVESHLSRMPDADVVRRGMGKKYLAGPDSEFAVSPEMVAEKFGFNNVSEMLRVLAEKGTFKQAVAEETDIRMDRMMMEKENFSADPTTPTGVQALFNDEYAQTLLVELNAFNRMTGRTNAPVQVYENFAKGKIDSTVLRDLHPMQYLEGERRSAREAEEAFKGYSSTMKAKLQKEKRLAESLRNEEDKLLSLEQEYDSIFRQSSEGDVLEGDRKAASKKLSSLRKKIEEVLVRRRKLMKEIISTQSEEDTDAQHKKLFDEAEALSEKIAELDQMMDEAGDIEQDKMEKMSSDRDALAAKRGRRDKKISDIVAAGKDNRANPDKKMAENLDEARMAKQRQILNQYLYRKALDAAKRVESNIKAITRFSRRSIRRGIDPEILEQMDSILSRVSFRKIPKEKLKDLKSLSQLLLTMEAEGTPTDLDVAELDALVRDPKNGVDRNYQLLTVAELDGLRDILEHLAFVGRNRNKIRLHNLRMKVEDGEATVVAAVTKNLPMKKMDLESDRPMVQAADFFGRAYGMLRKAAHLIRMMDGFEYGGVSDLFLRSVNESSSTAEIRRHKEALAMRDLFNRNGVKISRFAEAKPVPGTNLVLRTEAKLVIMLHWGNQQGRDRVRTLLGEGADAKVSAIGRSLTQQEWRFIQETWTYLQSFWPEIVQLHRRSLGFDPKAVTPLEFDSPFGKVSGGYFPIHYDPNKSSKSDESALDKLAKEAFTVRGGAWVQTDRGHTETRKESSGGRQISLSLHTLFTHVDAVVHDLAFRETVIGINKILARPKVREAMDERLGVHQTREIKNWLKRIAVGEQRAANVVEEGLTHLRSGVTISALGLRMGVSLLQLLGYSQSVDFLGIKWAAAGVHEFLTTWNDGAIERLYAQSEFMRTRHTNISREMRDTLLAVQDSEYKTKIAKAAFFMIVQMQKMVDIPTWMGAYEKAMSENATEEQAIAQADQAVRMSQGSGQIQDLASIEAGGPMLRLFTMFYTYFSTTFNNMADHAEKVRIRKDASYLPRLAWGYVLLNVIPAVLSDFIYGRIPDEDDDEGKMEWLLKNQLGYMASSVPIIRDVYGAYEGTYGDKVHPAGLRGFDALVRAGRELTDEDVGEDDLFIITDQEANALAEVVGIFAHVPLPALVRFITGTKDLYTGETDDLRAPFMYVENDK